MKKVMIALVAAAMAAGVQAATVSWKTGTGIKPDGSTAAATGTLNLYVWSVDQSTYDGTSLDSIWSTYGNTAIADIKDFSASVTGKGSSLGGTASMSVTAPTEGLDTYYGIVITTYDSDKDGTVDMYAVNKVTATVNTAGTAGGGQNVAKFIGGGTSGTAVTWSAAAVPEPTSAMLLLLGMAGLALKRRRA